MTPKGRIVDIDPVKRPGGCRRLIVPMLFDVAAGLVAVRFLVPLKRPILPRAVEVSDVQSAIEQEGDSLRVVVNWRMVQPRGPELAESTRVEVGISDGAQSQVATVPANEQSGRKTWWTMLGDVAVPSMMSCTPGLPAGEQW